jgi:hypothetical protein
MGQSIPSDCEVTDFSALGEDVVNVVHQIGENEAVSGGDFLGSIEETSEAARAGHQERSACYGSQLQEFAPVHACPPSPDPRFSFLASKTVNIVTPKDFVSPPRSSQARNHIPFACPEARRALPYPLKLSRCEPKCLRN